MTRLIRKATILTVWGLLVAGAALAAVPTNDSVLPTNPATGRTYCYLGGYSAPSPGLSPTLVGPGAFYAFNITVKSGPAAVVPFSVVKIDFSSCKKLYIAPTATDPPVNCGLNTVTQVANALGVATFAIVGESDFPTGAQNPTDGFESNLQGCAKVTADNGGGGVFATIGYLFVGTPNENHSSSGGHCSGADISVVIQNVAFCASPVATCFPNCFLNSTDLNQTGSVDGADIARMIVINGTLVGTGINGPGCDSSGGAANCCLPRIN